jgi:hypothetical protein
VIVVCTLTALSIVDVVAQQVLPTPSTVAAEPTARAPETLGCTLDLSATIVAHRVTPQV